ncbi:MAG: serine/threonine-protein kinase, partial [Thermoanaerobaculia bacterium]
MSEELPPRTWDLPTRTAESAIRHLALGTLLGGRYRILELAGAGGMGVVYRAQDEQLDVTVAVKVLRADLAQDGRWLERFKQELVLARQVTHPNVVRIHDIGSDGDLVFLTMDFVPGRSLRDLLEEHRRLAPERAAEIARQLALALGAAHRAGVIHRDLKPGNVLVEETAGGSLRVAITDFGIARSLGGAGLTVPGMVVGTLGYLSPEQARGIAMDGRSDLYTLGLLLYEMLTGELPFSAATEAEMLAQRLTGAPRNLRWGGVKVPLHLREVVQRLLARDPVRRYQSAAEVVRALDRRSVSPSSQIWRAAVAAFCLVALVALGWTVRERVRVAQRGPAPVAPAAPRHAIAILPLADDTGRPDLAWVATGIPEMLASSLAESPELRVLDSQRVLRTLEDLKLPRGPLPETEARRLAVLLDADRLVGGQVRAAGNRLRIDLSLLTTEPPGLPAAAFRA